jgi:hypothetical protein
MNFFKLYKIFEWFKKRKNNVSKSNRLNFSKYDYRYINNLSNIKFVVINKILIIGINIDLFVLFEW